MRTRKLSHAGKRLCPEGNRQGMNRFRSWNPRASLSISTRDREFGLLRVAQKKAGKWVAAAAAAGLVLPPAIAANLPAAKKKAPAIALSFDPVSSFTPANADPKLAAALAGKGLALTDFK